MKSRGFTLIELLVVISIISLLSSIVLASLNSARAKARDVLRIQTLDEFSKAVALYYSTTGHYPIAPLTADCWRGGINWIPDSGDYSWSSGYMSTQPHDPIDQCVWPMGGQGAQYDDPASYPSGTYAYWSDNGQRYALIARLELGGPYDIQNNNSKCYDGTSLYLSTCLGYQGPGGTAGWTNPRAYIKYSW